MTLCLNTKSAYIDFNMLKNDKYFVDKSGIIEKTNERVNTKNRYICITKPRRFGKTSVFNMLGAYYCRAYDSKALFDGLNISQRKTYLTHINKYNVIKMVNAISVRIDIQKEYSAGQETPANRKEIYSAMIIYGLLSYHEGELRIPNKELMMEFEDALEDDDFGYVADTVKN